MSTGSQNVGFVAEIERTAKDAASILRNFWNKVTGAKPAPLESGIDSSVRETDLTKFLAMLQTQASEEGITLKGTFTIRHAEIQQKLLAKEFDAAEPLLIKLSSDIKNDIGQRAEWLKVEAAFQLTKSTIDELHDKWTAPETMGTAGFKAVADSVANQVAASDYEAALSSYKPLSSVHDRLLKLLEMYPDRKLWDDLSDTFSKARKACEELGVFGAPEHGQLNGELESLRLKATPVGKDYKGAAAALPALAKRIQDLHALYPARGEWVALQATELIGAKRWLSDLNGWKAPGVEDLNKQLDQILVQATDTSKQYATAVSSLRTLYKTVDSAHRFWSKLRAVDQPFMDVMAEQPGNAGELRATMATASELGEDKKYDAAIAVLERLKSMLKAAESMKTDLNHLALQVTKSRVAGENGLNVIESKLRSQNHPEATRVAEILKQLVVALPSTLESKLREWDEATEAVAVTGLKAEVKLAAGEWLDFLATNKKHLDACAKNPFGVAFEFSTPLTATIKNVLKQATI